MIEKIDKGRKLTVFNVALNCRPGLLVTTVLVRLNFAIFCGVSSNIKKFS